MIRSTTRYAKVTKGVLCTSLQHGIPDGHSQRLWFLPRQLWAIQTAINYGSLENTCKESSANDGCFAFVRPSWALCVSRLEGRCAKHTPAASAEAVYSSVPLRASATSAVEKSGFGTAEEGSRTGRECLSGGSAKIEGDSDPPSLRSVCRPPWKEGRSIMSTVFSLVAFGYSCSNKVYAMFWRGPNAACICCSFRADAA